MFDAGMTSLPPLRCVERLSGAQATRRERPIERAREDRVGEDAIEIGRERDLARAPVRRGRDCGGDQERAVRSPQHGRRECEHGASVTAAAERRAARRGISLALRSSSFELGDGLVEVRRRDDGGAGFAGADRVDRVARLAQRDAFFASATPRRRSCATTTRSSPDASALSANLSARRVESVLSRSVIAVWLTSLAAGFVCFQTSTGAARRRAPAGGRRRPSPWRRHTPCRPSVMSRPSAVNDRNSKTSLTRRSSGFFFRSSSSVLLDREDHRPRQVARVQRRVVLLRRRCASVRPRRAGAERRDRPAACRVRTSSGRRVSCASSATSIDFICAWTTLSDDAVDGAEVGLRVDGLREPPVRALRGQRERRARRPPSSVRQSTPSRANFSTVLSRRSNVVLLSESST